MRRTDRPSGRTAELRHRYLALILDGMRAAGRGELPGPPPAWQEISERWNAELDRTGSAGWTLTVVEKD